MSTSRLPSAGARLARPLNLAAALVCASLLGCATPSERIESRATELGFDRRVITGAPYLHLTFARSGAAGSALHVYIENDGLPWRMGSQVAADPTPRKPVMLDAMALDPGPALYLGRPCYFVAARDDACNPLMWTHWRYAEVVVASMEAALRALLREQPYDRVVFFGHSGGGTLAVLLAERFAEAAAVVTLAANLNVAGWSELHGYSRLAGSLDPMQRPALRPDIFQWHLAGGRDQQVPVQLLEAYAASHPGAKVSVHPDQDHSCCWQALWPDVLLRLRELDAKGTRDPA